MARYSIEDTTLTNIANAIRTKTGSAETIQVSDMADEIKGIRGGGVTSWNDLTDKPDFAPVATSGSWNDLTDKPFGEETHEPVVFDGNLDGKVIMEHPRISTIKELYGEDVVWVYVKVSDVPFTKEQLEQAKFSQYSVIDGEVEHPRDLSAEFNSLEFDSKTVTGDNGLMILSFSEAGDYPIAPDDGMVFQPPEKGLYFVYQNIPKMQRIGYISGVTFSSQIKALDEKYIPDTIARKTDIPDIPTKLSELDNDAGFITADDVPEVGVTSWNDLKDKPFGEQEDYIELWSTTNIDSLTNGILPIPPIALKEGDKYRYTANGAAYETQIVKEVAVDSYWLIGGNPHVVFKTLPDNGQPLAFWYYSGNKTYFVTAKTPRVTKTFSAEKITMEFKLLDEKYIPESVVLESELEGKGYQTEEQVTALINEAISNLPRYNGEVEEI